MQCGLKALPLRLGHIPIVSQLARSRRCRDARCLDECVIRPIIVTRNPITLSSLLISALLGKMIREQTRLRRICGRTGSRALRGYGIREREPGGREQAREDAGRCDVTTHALHCVITSATTAVTLRRTRGIPAW